MPVNEVVQDLQDQLAQFAVLHEGGGEQGVQEGRREHRGDALRVVAGGHLPRSGPELALAVSTGGCLNEPKCYSSHKGAQDSKIQGSPRLTSPRFMLLSENSLVNYAPF